MLQIAVIFLLNMNAVIFLPPKALEHEFIFSLCARALVCVGVCVVLSYPTSLSCPFNDKKSDSYVCGRTHTHTPSPEPDTIADHSSQFLNRLPTSAVSQVSTFFQLQRSTDSPPRPITRKARPKGCNG